MAYQGEIFMSTGAFGHIDVEDMLTLAGEEGIARIELSSGARHRSPDLVGMLRQIDAGSLRFLVHNYFPVPERSFVLNLASDDAEMLELSRAHCRHAIDITAAVGAPFYSVHAGFCIHLKPEDLGQELHGKQIAKDRALEIFYESVRKLGSYASAKGVALAIENNVVAPFNLRNGRNDLLLGVAGDELSDLMRVVNMPNVGLLLDVAHLKVSANTLGFNAEATIEQIAPWIIGCHLSDNDGCSDSNEVLTEQSWCWEPLGRMLQSPPVWVIEVYNITPSTMKEQLRIVRESLRRHNTSLVN